MKVLLVEADEATRTLADEVLRAAGHELLVAADAAAAWAAFVRDEPPMIVVDLAAPTTDALAFVRRIREADEGATYVLVVTPRDAGTDLTAVLAEGVDDYVTRPTSVRNLRARLAIAERRIAQDAARRRTEAALARAQWLAGIGETSIALQHEINNPLAALLGHAALIENGLIDPGEEQELLAVIVEQAHRIAAVVKRLSALRNPQSVEYLQGARMIDLSKPSE